MANLPETRRYFELLAPGDPASLAMIEFGRVLKGKGESYHQVRLAASHEQGKYGPEDRFIPLLFTPFDQAKLRNDPLVAKFGEDKVLAEVALHLDGHTNFPVDSCKAAYLAAAIAKDRLDRTLRDDLLWAKERNYMPYVCVFWVPEGPMGTGGCQFLLSFLPQWRREFIDATRRRGLPDPELFHLFLLEFVPANPAADGGNEGSYLQGQISRFELYPRTGSFKHLVWDGFKHSSDNKVATRLGAVVLAHLLTSMFTPNSWKAGKEG